MYNCTLFFSYCVQFLCYCEKNMSLLHDLREWYGWLAKINRLISSNEVVEFLGGAEGLQKSNV